MLISKTLDTQEKLKILSQDSRYDLACACGTRPEEHRLRSKDDKWIYPVVLPSGGRTYLFKTLLSNQCLNNCKYCPLRAGADAGRCALGPEELAKAFLAYYYKRRVSGLFLSSAVTVSPDATMEKINRAAVYLRRSNFRGYIHLKIIPGCSEAAIRQALSVSNAVSLNIETAGEKNFKLLSTTKDYQRDILKPIELISRLTQKGSCFSRVHQTTQFVVGASLEKDREIMDYSWKLYKRLNLNRIYFSAYQRGAGTADLPGENSKPTSSQLLAREHRLYQADWLMRKYGFRAEEIPVGQGGDLSLETDPKEMWAKAHPEFFPVNINNDDKYRLLRVPGLGQVIVERVLEFRKNGSRIRSLTQLGRPNKLFAKAASYIVF